MTAETQKSDGRRHEQLIAGLLSQPTIAKAAQAAKISEATALRLLRNADFQRAYRAARRQVLEQAVAVLQQRCVVASAVLVEIAGDREQKGSTRISAARSILEFSLRGAELFDIETRLAEIERRLEET